MLPLCLNRGCTKCLCHIGHGTLSSERGAKGALWRCIWCFGGKVVSQELRHSSRTDWQKLDQSVEKWGKWLKLAEICKTEARSWYFVSCFVLECWELDALLLKLQHSYRGWHCLVTSAQSFTMIFWPHLVLIVVPEVTTSKYTLLSFLPLVTFEQFQKPGADILSRMFSFMNVWISWT